MVLWQEKYDGGHCWFWAIAKVSPFLLQYGDRFFSLEEKCQRFCGIFWTENARQGQGWSKTLLQCYVCWQKKARWGQDSIMTFCCSVACYVCWQKKIGMPKATRWFFWPVLWQGWCSLFPFFDSPNTNGKQCVSFRMRVHPLFALAKVVLWGPFCPCCYQWQQVMALVCYEQYQVWQGSYCWMLDSSFQHGQGSCSTKMKLSLVLCSQALKMTENVFIKSAMSHGTSMVHGFGCWNNVLLPMFK